MLHRALFIALCLHLGYAANISQRIYLDVDSVNGFRSCVRMTNGKKQVGCSSPSGGAHGVVHLVNTSADLELVVSKGNHGPYIPLLPQIYFTAEHMATFKRLAPKRISGVLVILDTSSTQNGSFSPDRPCPNEGFGLYPQSKCTWNANGNSLLLEDFSFPVFALFQGSDLDTILGCARNYSAGVDGSEPDYPLCAASMEDYMYAVKDTYTCMKQGTYGPVFGSSKRCDALYGYNVWGTLSSRNASEEYTQRDIILVMTSLDSRGFFFDYAPGAEHSVSGVIALLAALDALRPALRSDPAWAKKVVFAFFNGESFDYIGSSRMVYDMKDNFPAKVPTGDNILAPANFNLSNVKTIIELGQVGLGSTPNELFLHYDTNSPLPTSMTDLLKSHGNDSGLTLEDGFGTLPPASAQMFLRDDAKIGAVFIADHNATYSNQYYNSYLDDAENLKVTTNLTTSATVVQLTNLAKTIARTIASFSSAPDSEVMKLNASATYVRDLTLCLTVDFNCSLLKNVFPPKTDLPNKFPIQSRYMGLNNAGNNHLVNAIQRLVADSIGRDNLTANSSSACKAPTGDTLNARLYMSTGPNNGTLGRCVIAPVYRRYVSSPAFLSTPVDYHSTRYSTWTESVWQTISMKLYLKPSPQSQHTAIGVGVTFLLIFVGLAVQVNRTSSSLFAIAPGATGT